MLKIGINGFGRIGRLVLRILHEQSKSHQVVAINDLTDNETLAHLLKFDSNYGRFPGDVEVTDDGFSIDAHQVVVTGHRSPADIPWGEHDVDLVIECSGVFKKRAQAAQHLAAGATKVLISSPSPDSDFDVVIGVNEQDYDHDNHHVVSNASCTTNSLAAIMQILDDWIGVEQAMLTTIHAYTNGQNILDGPHKDLRRARNAGTNIIPTTTGAAKAIGRLLPRLNDTFDGVAVRVPTATGSLCDVTLMLGQDVSADEINAIIANAAATTHKGTVGYSTDPLVSSDIVGDPHSGVFDSLSTRTMGKMAKIFVWYDNEWGYSCRMVDAINLMSQRL